ncbi:MAG: stage II sporulation protein M [Conexivisphaerales archaeon]
MTAPHSNSDSQWLRIFLLVFIIQLALFYVIVSLPISNSEATSLSNAYSSLNETIQTQASLFSKAMYIYTHNLFVALIEIIPFLGVAFFGYSTYVTSRTLEAIAVTQPAVVSNLSPQLVVTALLFYPHSWLELPAYALAVTESFYLIRALFSRKLSSEYHRAVSVAILIAVQLFVAATVESAELLYPSVALYLWIPSIVYFFFFLRLVSRVSKGPAYSKTELSGSPK